MDIEIRQEAPRDYNAVFELVKAAFKHEALSDQNEQFLVERLRISDAFIPELSLVAEHGNQIVGHILLTKVRIKNDQTEYESLALAPVSVRPDYQGKGIGRLLIEQSHNKAKELEYTSIILLGHETYYQKFGYRQADRFGIELPFNAPKENCMVIELTKNSLNGVSGKVDYPEEFYV